jgi:hypothetical protein
LHALFDKALRSCAEVLASPQTLKALKHFKQLEGQTRAGNWGIHW